MHKFISTFCLLVLFFSGYGQKKLRVGEKIPAAKVEVYSKDQQLTNLNLPNGKTAGDRFVLLLFFTTNQPLKQMVEINQQIEQILNRFQNNACKGASEIEYLTICAETDDKKWQNYLEQANLNSTKFTGKKTNYLAKNGLNDQAVKTFGADKFPLFFVINPKGRLWLETDSTPALEQAFVNICRTNASSSTADIAGKLLEGTEKILKPLTDLKVFLINQKEDTLRATKTDNYGDFTFNKVDTTQKLSITVEQNEKIKAAPKVYLAKQSGDVISEIVRSSKGVFEYRLLKADVVVLSPVDDADDIALKYKKFDKSGTKNISVSELIYYETGKYNITFEGELILDKVITILKANPTVHLEVIAHTDSRGEDASNLALSQKRAGAVLDYLVSKGIDKTMLKAIGKGENGIRNRCTNGVECSGKEHEFNRRTEFNFIKN